MELFRGSFSNKENAGILSHFGSMTAAAHRLDSIYVTQQPRTFTSTGTFKLFDTKLRPVRDETAQEAVQRFADFMQHAVLAEYSVDIKNPLHLKDCWTDDPIGSGALEIFQDNMQLTREQRQELDALFHPFENVIYPEHVAKLLSKNDVLQIKEKRAKDTLFQQEMQKRRYRSEKLGIPFHYAEEQEVVWTDLTLKLRTWALQNKFDAFAYKNDSEGQGEESYVTLAQSNKIQRTGNFKFNRKSYLETIAPVFDDFLKSVPSKNIDSKLVTGLYWAGHDAADFWMPS